ncbi:MAG: DUF5312 domain-containing protein [Treponema sp.]|nr:DUF5312 domain-containing protein [Treponema sp.]
MAAAAHDDNDVFEALSKSISDDERHEMLEKVKSKSPEKDEMLAEKLARFDDDYEYEFQEALKKQTVFQRVIMFIWACLTNSSVKDVLNKHLLSGYAKRIEVLFPGLIVFDRKVVGNLFYEKLRQLNSAIKFFVPYMDNYPAEAGDYYFVICHEAASDFEKNVYDKSDPYKFPLTKPIPDSEKIKLKDELKRNLAAMDPDDKKCMDDVIQMLEWLHQLSNVSIDRILTMFTSEENGYNECLFVFLRSDLDNLIEIMCNSVPLDDRIIDFFCLLASRHDIDMNAFRNEAVSSLSVIANFANNLPLADIAKIIKNKAFYNVPMHSFSVKWYDSFLKKWLSVFEDRFSAWTKDFCREQIKVKLHNLFDLDDFPQFPNRPWEELGGGFSFSHSLTMGLLYFFMHKYFNSYNKSLQTISIKGEFSSKENLHELNESIDSFIMIHEEMKNLENLFGDDGDYYEEFRIFHSLATKTSNSIKRVHVIMENVSQEVVDMHERFSVMCQHLINILEGCLSDRRTGKYCSLLNLNRLVEDGVDFKDTIKKRLQGIKDMFEVIKDVEILEG